MLTTTANKPLRWQKTKYSPIARQRDIFRAAFSFAFFLWWDNLWQNNSAKVRNRRANWLVTTLLDLGPTFIKIGQSLSTRVDLLPKEYVVALSRLQDQVPEFDAAQAVTIIETELGQSLHSVYLDFDHEPIAAASLGQVHKAKLHTGEEVVVKVQRPGLKSLFDLDSHVIAKLLKLVRRWFPRSKKYQLEEIYSEFFTILYQEIDYCQEGRNVDRFAENFNGQAHILTPTVYWQYTTTKVMTMEYLPGIKIDDRQALEACGLDPKEINKVGISCYLKQLLEDGFFHADPHPGNIAVSQEGNLIFYDFGMMWEVPAIDKDQMVKTFFAVLKKDTNQVIDTLTTMGLLEPVADMTPVRRVMKFMLDKFTEKPVDLKAFEQMQREVYAIFEQQPFRLPAKMTYILKSLTTLDGIARILDPEYNITAAAQPFVKSITLAKSKQGGGSVVGELARQAKGFIADQFNKPTRAELLINDLEGRIERGELEFKVRSTASDRTLKRINLVLKTLTYTCMSGFLLLSGTVLLVAGYTGWAIALFMFAGLGGIFLVRSFAKLILREKLDKLAE
ncbi:ABC-1 domain-containing protein [Thalassoporum mexicanum PCC 7367]|uniref:ABC1 kinase family protein n=1 Tax=Thalassoporum mexicanum TaxID=3457544 RepID=UPI00029FE024|nr:AarF/ABC1/UbiB kinase family protein [Pseudanabaena sp. PCC 7367]AFY68439.1 ABC-1 domain-containing protein [Pseudanabaena sp. PCC 7367]